MWELICYGAEAHGGETYDAQFCKFGSPAQRGLFCTVGGNLLSVYNTRGDKTTTMVQRFVDENEEEEYFCCTWLLDSSSGDLLIAAAGLKGCIKVVNCRSKKLERHLVGHGNAINDLATHPHDKDLLFSASKDESLRMWNVRTGNVLAVFGGDNGHRDEVLSVSVHGLGNCILSAGMDHSIKVWALDSEDVTEAIKHKNNPEPRRTVFQEGPIFSTYRVHSDYVDCARWVGDLILSKSTGNEAVLWKPCSQRRKDAVTVVKRYALPDTNIWYLRLDVDSKAEMFACGNTKGRIFVYDIDSGNMIQQLKFRTCRHPVRKLAFNSDSNIVVAACSDSSIWRWDAKDSLDKPSSSGDQPPSNEDTSSVAGGDTKRTRVEAPASAR